MVGNKDSPSQAGRFVAGSTGRATPVDQIEVDPFAQTAWSHLFLG